MHNLSEADTGAFLDRFYNFYDSLLKNFEIVYAEGGVRSVVVRLASRDSMAVVDNGKVSIQFLLYAAEDIRFFEYKKTTSQVLSNGLHISWFNGGVGIELGDLVEAPESFDELKTSKLFAFGKSLSWSIGKYQPFANIPNFDKEDR